MRTPWDAASARNRCMVDRGELAGIRPTAEQNLFRVFLIPKDLVVQHQCDHRKLQPLHRLDLRPGMGKSTIAGDADNAPIGRSELGTDGEGQAPAQAGQSRGVRKRCRRGVR